jgi:dihydrofolate reductase
MIVSRDPAYRPATGEVFASIESAIAAVPPQQKLFVAGGAQIYTQTLAIADMILLTHIEREIAGDASFPLLNAALWQCTAETHLTEADTLLRFCTYEKKT